MSAIAAPSPSGSGHGHAFARALAPNGHGHGLAHGHGHANGSTSRLQGLMQPLEYGEPVKPSTLAMGVSSGAGAVPVAGKGVREVVPGPPSPPAGLLRLGEANGHGSGHGHGHRHGKGPGQGHGHGAKREREREERKGAGLVNGNGNGNGHGLGLVQANGAGESPRKAKKAKKEGTVGAAATKEIEAGPSEHRVMTPVGTPKRTKMDAQREMGASASASASGVSPLHAVSTGKAALSNGKGKHAEEDESADSSTASPAPSPSPLKRKSVSDTNGAPATPSRPIASTVPITSPSTPKSKAKAASRELRPALPDSALQWPALPGRAWKAAGLDNPSMACYSNATLQVMMHTPPLISEALRHPHECALRQEKRLCMLCEIRDMALQHWKGPRGGKKDEDNYYKPGVHRHLSLIRKGLSTRRQEDTHEFFRFATDALQNQALYGLPKNLDEKIKHTSWVHRIWGGRVRSQVVCGNCHQPSDTYDNFLDLSLDCHPKARTIERMLEGFIKMDKLEGDNKYHCEKCKRKANATKSFRIAEAPPVLTLHLKRFSVSYNTYSGRPRAHKFNEQVSFPDRLDIAPYMIKGSTQPTRYRLFGVTCHRGNELRCGHYNAYVKNRDGRWLRANDDEVRGVKPESIFGDRSAYLLSYIRETDGEDGASGMNERVVNGDAAEKSEEEEEDDHEGEEEQTPRANGNGHVKRVVATNGTDPLESEDEDERPANVLQPRRKTDFIGPVQPKPLKFVTNSPRRGSLPGVDGPARSPQLFNSRFDSNANANAGPSRRPAALRTPSPDPAPGGAALREQEDDDDDDDDAPDERMSKFGSAMGERGSSKGKGSGLKVISGQKFYPSGHGHGHGHGRSPQRFPGSPGRGKFGGGGGHWDKKKGRREDDARGKARSHSSPFAAGGGGARNKIGAGGDAWGRGSKSMRGKQQRGVLGGGRGRR